MFKTSSAADEKKTTPATGGGNQFNADAWAERSAALAVADALDGSGVVRLVEHA